MENALRANPQDLREQHEEELKDLKEAYDEAMLELRTRKNSSPCWARTRNDRLNPSGTQKRWLQCLDQPAVSLVRGSAQMFEENPSFGYRTVAHLLKFNKNTVSVFSS